ncbi:MAG TPA: hypothetical protein PKC22_05535 [Rhodocyclaceae bacterium]|nr:hypothetical protein [Rhodocyclaceae bacterium]
MKSESVPLVPFALPEIGQQEIDEVVDTLRSGWIACRERFSLHLRRGTRHAELT